MEHGRVAIALTIAMLVNCGDGVGVQRTVEAADSTLVEQEISGTDFYNVLTTNGEAELRLDCTAMTRVTYTVTEGADLATVEGSKVTITGDGVIIIAAIAEESSVYAEASMTILIAANGNNLANDAEESVQEYSGEAVGYSCESLTGADSYSCEYADASVSNIYWYADEQSEIGTYFVRITIYSGEESFYKFGKLTITQKTLTLENVTAASKVYDGTAGTTLSADLVGAVDGEEVRVVCPTAQFDGVDAGEHGIEVTNGDFTLSGDAKDNYRLDEVDLSSVTGKILKASVIITANNKTSTQYRDLAELTYTLSKNVEFTKEPTLSCSVTKSSKAGEYEITVSGAKSKNYKFSYVNGTYTLIQGTKPSKSTSTSTSSGDTSVSSSSGTKQSYNSTVVEDVVEQESGDDSDSDSEEEEVFDVWAAGTALEIDGIVTGLSIGDENVTVEKVLTSSGVVQMLSSQFEMRYNGSKWSNALNLVELSGTKTSAVTVEDGVGSCWLAEGVTIEIRDRVNKELKGALTIGQFVVDREVPVLTVEGIELVDQLSTEVTRTRTEAITIDVGVLWGLSGKSTLQYAMLSSSYADAWGVLYGEDYSDWKTVTGGKITLDQDFTGSVVICATDCLGNYTTVITECVQVDCTAPKVNGVKSGDVVNGSVSYTVDVEDLASVTVDGEVAEPSGTITGKGQHIIVATDLLGNTEAVTFTIKGKGIFWLFKGGGA